jgi:hypothetical protein
MSIEKIISKINQELISSFAELDSWFDCEERFLFEKSLAGQWSVAETLEHVMLTNRHLLFLIGNIGQVKMKKDPGNMLQHYNLEIPEIEYLASGRYPWHFQDHLQPQRIKTPAEIRSRLRDQLYSCLQQLDLLACGEGTLITVRIPVETPCEVAIPCELDAYQSLYLLALHAKRHCTQLSGRIRFPVDWLV